MWFILAAVTITPQIVHADRAFYTEPASGNTATLVIQNETNWNATSELYMGGKLCSQRRHLLSTQGEFTKKTKLPVNQEIAFALQIIETKPADSICKVMFSFVPKARVTYLASIRTIGDNAKKCAFGLVRLHPDGIYSPVEYWQRTYRAGTADKESFCLPERVHRKQLPEDTADENEHDDSEGPEEPKKVESK